MRGISRRSSKIMARCCQLHRPAIQHTLTDRHSLSHRTVYKEALWGGQTLRHTEGWARGDGERGREREKRDRERGDKERRERREKGKRERVRKRRKRGEKEKKERRETEEREERNREERENDENGTKWIKGDAETGKRKDKRAEGKKLGIERRKRDEKKA